MRNTVITSISLPVELLNRLDAYAKDNLVSRSTALCILLARSPDLDRKRICIVEQPRLDELTPRDLYPDTLYKEV